MCGISGLYKFKSISVDKSEIEAMNSLIKHRGPDGSGVYTEDNIGLGSTRLAIIDLSHEADMPLFDTDGRYVIVYNGEIFNFIELRKHLMELGHRFHTNSDTEVVLNAYKEWGEECLHKFNGMWAFALWDKFEKKLFCSRDRYGIKPFYYYTDTEKFIFGSEIKQILYFDINKSVNEEIIYDFVLFNFLDHTDSTFINSVKKLPAGHKLILRDNRINISRWYHLEENINNSLIGEKLYDQFYQSLYDSVKIRLRSDVEVGSCLSGGLDSSSIVCLMHNILHDEGKTEIQKTYTACYDEPSLDERPYVNEIIEKTKSTKYFLYPTYDELLNDFDNLLWHQDEPIAGLSVFSQWSVFKKIHETNLKVVLDGQGADEILLGYFSFYPFYLKRILQNPFGFMKNYFRGVDTTQLGFFKFGMNFLYFNSPGLRYAHLKNLGRKYLNSNFISLFKSTEKFKQLISGSLTENRFSNLWNISLPSLLRYEDKNSMAFSVEARLPFLDHRLVELIFSIPFGELIKDGWTKNVLRESMKNILPEKVRKRKGKLAFSVPQDKWVQSLVPIMKDTFLNSEITPRFFNKQNLISMLEKRNYDEKMIFRSFCLLRWMNVFKISS